MQIPTRLQGAQIIQIVTLPLITHTVELDSLSDLLKRREVLSWRREATRQAAISGASFAWTL